FVSATGGWFQGVALGWLVLDLTGSPAALGWVMMAMMGPVSALGVFGGALVDRIDRRRLVLVTTAIGAVAVGAMAALVFTDRATMTTIIICALVLGTANAALWPAMQSFLKELVPGARLRDAIAVNSARFHLTRVLGPAIAGVVLARFGPAVCLAITAVSMLGVMVAAWFIHRPTSRKGGGQPLFSAITEGIRFVRGERFVFRTLVVTAVFSIMVVPYESQLPTFVREVLNAGAERLGLLLSTVGFGAVAGAVLSGTPLVKQRPGVWMAVYAMAAGVALLVLALTAPGGRLPQPFAIGALALSGFGVIGYLTTANATVQVRVPEPLMGRVMGLWVVVNAGGVPLGSVLMGSAAERVSLPTVLLWSGAIGIAVGVFALATRIFIGSRHIPATEATEVERLDRIAETLAPKEHLQPEQRAA
ncbi:MAG TPA: MFS transporter, partial [Chloroflexota bacterium]|nr:MFS transporter [Chloroflexota bacterium]